MLSGQAAAVKPVLKYAGAKWRLADWIGGLLPPHEIYLEPFFGSGAVFFRKAPARLETINDIDGNVVNLFRVLREQTEQLAALVELTPWARDEYYASYEKSGNDLEDARRFLVRCWQAFGTMTAARTGWRHSATGRSPVMPQQWNGHIRRGNDRRTARADVGGVEGTWRFGGFERVRKRALQRHVARVAAG